MGTENSMGTHEAFEKGQLSLKHSDSFVLAEESVQEVIVEFHEVSVHFRQLRSCEKRSVVQSLM